MNCIFLCVFCHDKYVDLLFLLLESIYMNCDLTTTEILIYTSTSFMKRIQKSNMMSKHIRFEINDSISSIKEACCSRLDLFTLPSVSRYTKLLYLDTDILVKEDITKCFNIIEKNILYTVQEGEINDPHDYWGTSLFGNEAETYEDKSAFTSGILLFRNCKEIYNLFENIKQDLVTRAQYINAVFDQPFIVYNAFKYNMFDNKILNQYVVNNIEDINTDKWIHHFCGGPGNGQLKYQKMTKFWSDFKDSIINSHIETTKQIINNHLLPIIFKCGEPLEGNIFMNHQTTTYTDDFIHKVKNISSLVLNRTISKVMEIGFNAGFSTLLMLVSNPNITISCFDLGEHSYTKPCFEKLQELFPDRLTIIYGDSTKTLPLVSSDIKYDMIHIDGGHSTDVAENDIIYSYSLCKQGTILIMDDYNFSNLHQLWDTYIKKLNLKSVDMLIYPTPFHDVKFVSFDYTNGSLN